MTFRLRYKLNKYMIQSRHRLNRYCYILSSEYLSFLVEEDLLSGRNLNENEKSSISSNKNLIYLLNEKNIRWYDLSENYYAIEILKKNKDKIMWYAICYNENPEVIQLLEEKNENEPNFLENNIINLAENCNAINIINNYTYMFDVCDSRYNYHKLCDSFWSDSFWWNNLCKNKNVLEIIYKLWPNIINFENFWNSIETLASNPNATEFFEQNLKYLVDNKNNTTVIRGMFRGLSRNQNAIYILETNFDEIELISLCENKNPDAIPLIEKIIKKNEYLMGTPNLEPSIIGFMLYDHIISHELSYGDSLFWNYVWRNLSSNFNAIPLLEKYKEFINWEFLSMNTNPKAIEILKNNIDNIDWERLSENPSGVSLLENNIEKTTMNITNNPNACHLVYKIDKDKMIKQIKNFKEELLKYVCNPKRLFHIIELYCDEDVGLLEYNEMLWVDV
jgi:hypothetical protein